MAAEAAAKAVALSVGSIDGVDMGDDDDRILVSYEYPREMYMIVIERLSLQIVATASLERTRMVGIVLGNAMHTARTVRLGVDDECVDDGRIHKYSR